jgi:Leucine-rich repeat (LRR) protein
VLANVYLNLAACLTDRGKCRPASQIGVLKELRRLDLSGANIDDEGLPRIADLPLEELWLQGTRITDASVPTVSRMKTLVFVQLNATGLSDEFLEHLESLPALNKLGLRGTQETGAGMKFLSRHRNLTQLDVYHTKVDDAGVRSLVNCQSLTSIGLSMTNITDDVFISLNLLPSLSGADITANPISKAAILTFQKTHPQCDIEW